MKHKEKTEKNIVKSHQTKMTETQQKDKNNLYINSAMYLSVIDNPSNGFIAPIKRQSGWMD